MADLELRGCSTEPLLNYLKGLGVLRLISEQINNNVRGAWRNGSLVLRGDLDFEDVSHFFQDDYVPSPIVVPWSGKHYFNLKTDGDLDLPKRTPTATTITEAFLHTRADRFAKYRQVMQATLAAMRMEGIELKEDLKDKKSKSRLLSRLRSNGDEELVNWIDAAVTMDSEKATYNILLGSGGGSDGNTHFSANFMQHLWDVLPEFGHQREKGRTSGESLLECSLTGRPTAGLSDRTGALFSSGAVGGPNASQGYEGESQVNSWDFILAVEGTLCFAGAISRQLSSQSGLASFPFTVSLCPTGYASAVAKEANQREIWLPVWDRFATYAEIKQLFAEGRAQTGKRYARSGTDFARAVASFGVDAGVNAFHRYAFVKGRVGGENYNTAVPLGRYEVSGNKQVQLLLEIEGWLEAYRRACSGESVPGRFRQTLRSVEQGILDLARYGGERPMLRVLCALGQAERELADGKRFREEHGLRPIGPLSPEWTQACDDGSTEYRLALALASIRGDAKGLAGDLRANLEPVEDQRTRWVWGSEVSCVWRQGELSNNLLAVLWQRVMDSERANAQLAVAGVSPASIDEVANFIWGMTDDRALEEMIWGLVLVSRRQPWPSLAETTMRKDAAVPRLYAMLKMVFLPSRMRVAGREPVQIRPEPEVIRRLRLGDRRGAIQVAARRLRASGIRPGVVEGELMDPAVRVERIGAGLLIPVKDLSRLRRMVLQMEKED